VQLQISVYEIYLVEVKQCGNQSTRNVTTGRLTERTQNTQVNQFRGEIFECYVVFSVAQHPDDIGVLLRFLDFFEILDFSDQQFQLFPTVSFHSDFSTILLHQQPDHSRHALLGVTDDVGVHKNFFFFFYLFYSELFYSELFGKIGRMCKKFVKKLCVCKNKCCRFLGENDKKGVYEVGRKF
jgi:hypothetical protein